ncbi:MAG TPA: metal-sensing transcriptional repressor [Firmicutes bacterium]|nr:metal-sensing transcriptional repressor [Bacillota bacterium]
MRSDREYVMQMLKTARGQIDGLIKMVEDDRYCIDISHQIMAVQAILRKVNKEILHGHLNHCVKEAFATDAAREKTDEVMAIIDQLLKG